MTHQWGVHWAELDPIRGSEQAGRRPVIVVSRESINRSLSVLAVIPVTTRRSSGKVYDSEVLLPAGTGGLSAESLALGHQVRTISKERLCGYLGQIEDPSLRGRIKYCLRLFLDLD